MEFSIFQIPITNSSEKHLRNSTKNPNLILTSFCKNSPEFSHMVYPLRSLLTDVTIKGTQINFPLNTHEYFTCIVGCCDGLLCLAQGKLPNRGDSFQAVVWNPSIRKYKILPSPNFPHQNFGTTIMYSFGYDHLTCNYKVVAIFKYICHNSNVYKTQVKVHILGTDSWRLIEEFSSVISSANYHLGLGEFVSGAINWLVPIDCSYNLRPIVSLDSGTESYQQILQPDYGEEEVVMVTSCSLWVLRDCLCILRGHRINSSDIWLMKEYGNRESWIRLVNITYGTNYSYISMALYIFEHDQVLLEFWPTFQRSLAVYESINGTMKILDVDNDKFNGLHLPEIFVESFIWPCS